MFGSNPLTHRSLQLYHLSLPGGRCNIFAPDERLKNVIDYYWFLEITEPSVVLDVIPDTAIDLVLSPEIARIELTAMFPVLVVEDLESLKNFYVTNFGF